MFTDTQPKPQPDFTSSRQKELDSLLKRGIFEFVKTTNVLIDACIFSSRFVD